MENESSSFWAEVYDGKFGTILFGHQPFFDENPFLFKKAVGLDLGCVFGGYLLAYIMDIDGVRWEKVKALKNYVIKYVEENVTDIFLYYYLTSTLLEFVFY